MYYNHINLVSIFVAEILMLGFIVKGGWLMESSNGIKPAILEKEEAPAVTDELNLR